MVGYPQDPTFHQDMVDLLFAAQMCGCTVQEAVDSVYPLFYQKGKPVFSPMMVKPARLSWSLWAPIRDAVFDRDGYACTYCGDEDGPHEIDHIKPVTLGGGHELENLCVACRPCNISKSNRTLSEWKGRQ